MPKTLLTPLVVLGLLSGGRAARSDFLPFLRNPPRWCLAEAHGRGVSQSPEWSDGAAQSIEFCHRLCSTESAAPAGEGEPSC
jgi:hypothetical protein